MTIVATVAITVAVLASCGCAWLSWYCARASLASAEKAMDCVRAAVVTASVVTDTAIKIGAVTVVEAPVVDKRHVN